SEFRVHGLCAATFTPLKDDGELNLDYIGVYCDHLVSQGVMNIFVNGTTGEGPLLTLDERKLVAEAWVKAGRGKLDKIIIHVGTTNLKDTQCLAQHAEKIGAHAISTIPPTFFKPKSVGSLVKYCKDVAGAAPTLPFFYYHIPQITGVEFMMLDFLKAAKSEIATLRGIKYSWLDLVDAAHCLRFNDGKYQIMWGRDEQLLTALVLGIDSAVGSTYNFMPRLYQRMIEAFEKGDIWVAQKEMYRIQDAVLALFKHESGIGPLKAITQSVALSDLGPVRSPIDVPRNENMDGVLKDLHDMGFNEWIK
ncbi:unnamed protein product, partial [Owenia fusiformis]